MRRKHRYINSSNTSLALASLVHFGAKKNMYTRYWARIRSLNVLYMGLWAISSSQLWLKLIIIFEIPY